MKQCSMCGEWKDDDFFYRRQNSSLRAECKGCFGRQRKEYRDAYYQEHKETDAVRNREYHKKHPEVARTAAHRRRALKQGAPIADFTANDWSAILDIYDHRCAYCRKSGVLLTQDHVVPLSRGGNHSVDNIVPACLSCNASKGTKTLEDWRQIK